MSSMRLSACDVTSDCLCPLEIHVGSGRVGLGRWVLNGADSMIVSELGLEESLVGAGWPFLSSSA